MSDYFDSNKGVSTEVESSFLDEFDDLAADKNLASACSEMLRAIGEDGSREGLIKTPARFAKAWQDMTSGYHQSLSTIVNDALFEATNDDIVLVKDIEVFSMCEHHMLPFWGRVHVAYIPDGKVIGLSKLPRIANMFARRLQLQERMTEEIADAVEQVLMPKGVAVVSECRHMCMMMRGVEKTHSTTISRVLKGAFKDNQSLRRECLEMMAPRPNI